MNADVDAGLSAGFHLMQPAAATAATRVDALFGVMLLLCGAVALVVCVLVIAFAWRYRHNAPARRPRPRLRSPWLETAWTVAPLLVFLGLFAWSARDYLRLYAPPANALPVQVVAKQWMWKLQHRNGHREINELHVPLGQPVELTMASQDAIHSFYVPAFRIKQDVLPGRTTRLWFTATQLGEYRIFCAEYCGSQHSHMLGRVVVMRPQDYARWLASGTGQPGLAQQGFALYRRLGCSGCHEPGSTVHAPPLDGLAGRTVQLQDGRSVLADDAYLRDSILLPRRDVAAGYEPIMPSYAGQASEEDLLALVAYLHSTADAPLK
jgi:cytochrome c oxidase subunit 2